MAPETTSPSPRPAPAPSLDQALADWKEKALAEQSAHVERLQRRKLEAEEELAAAQSRLGALAQAVKQNEERVKDLQALRETAEREYAKVLEQLREARQEMRAINTAKGLKPEHEALTDAVAKLRVTKGELAAEVADLDKRRTTLRSALDELRMRLG